MRPAELAASTLLTEKVDWGTRKTCTQRHCGPQSAWRLQGQCSPKRLIRDLATTAENVSRGIAVTWPRAADFCPCITQVRPAERRQLEGAGQRIHIHLPLGRQGWVQTNSAAQTGWPTQVPQMLKRSISQWRWYVDIVDRNYRH